MIEKLTDAIVRKALPPALGQYFIWDCEIKGFAVRVTARGATIASMGVNAGLRLVPIPIGLSKPPAPLPRP